MGINTHTVQRTIFIALCFFLSNSLQAGEWFKDPETGCAVWSDHPQPIVTVYWSGDCVDGNANGKGILKVLIDQIPFSSYEGEYKEGKAHGYGVLITPDKSRYEGEFKNNRMHGHGIIKSNDGKQIEGNFINGNPHGILKITQPDGTTVELEFDNGKRM